MCRNKNAWTHDDDFLILDMRSKGEPLGFIAKKMGKTANAISKRFRSLKHPNKEIVDDDRASFGFLGKHINGVLA